MKNLLSLGDRLSHKLKNLKHDGKFLSPMEIVEETGMVMQDTSGEFRLQEAILPSRNNRPEEDFIEQNGIMVPTTSIFFQNWPQECTQQDLEITFFCNFLSQRKQFWARVEKQNGTPIMFFESIRDDIIPWTDVNLLPERVIDLEVYELLTQQILEHYPDQPAYAIKIPRHGMPFVYWTMKLNGQAHTIIDIGCAHELSKYLFNLFNSVLNENLYDLFSIARKKLDDLRNTDLSEFTPTFDLYESEEVI